MRTISLILTAFLLLSGVAHAQQNTRNQAVFRQTFNGSITPTTKLVVPTNLLRRYLLIVNLGGSTAYCKPGGNQGAAEGTPIYGGGNWEPLAAPTNEIYCLSGVSTTTNLLAVEGE